MDTRQFVTHQKKKLNVVIIVKWHNDTHDKKILGGTLNIRHLCISWRK
jgi:hypothetical protein